MLAVANIVPDLFFVAIAVKEIIIKVIYMMNMIHIQLDLLII